MLAKGSALAARLAAVERNLKKRETASAAERNQSISSLQAAIAKEQEQRAQALGQDSARKSLEEKLRGVASRQSELQEELSAAQKEIKNHKESVKSVRALTAQVEAEREQERRKFEHARREQLELSKSRETAEKAKNALQTKILAAEQKLREQESAIQLAKASVEQKQQALRDMPKKPTTPQAVVEVPAQPQPEAPREMPNAEVEVPAQPPPQSQPQPQPLPAKPKKTAPPPLRETHLSFASDGGPRPDSSQGVSPGQTDKSPQQAASTMPVWAHVAGKLFNNLDRLGTGYIDSTQVMQLWPVLSRHVDTASGAPGLAAKLLQSIAPMNNSEWMSLMHALSSIVGPKRLRHNIHAAQANLAELQSGNPGAAVISQGPQPRQHHKSHRHRGDGDSRMARSDPRPV